jgi:hypothetical protein
MAEPRERQALLTFSVVGGGLRGVGTAAEIRALINGALVSYPSLKKEETRVLLFEQQSEILFAFRSSMRSAARQRLKKLGIEVFTGAKVSAITPADVGLANGQRFPCRTVVDALSSRPNVVARLPLAGADGRLPVDQYLQCRGVEHMLAVGDCAATPRLSVDAAAPPFNALREIKMGRLAAYNALAAHRGYKLMSWSEKRSKVSVAALGRYATVANILGIDFAGIPAWIVARGMCLVTLPGLERNLRALADWLLDIPFRGDIAVLAPQPTRKLDRAHFEPGDVIIRQGDRGDCAYLIRSGEVEVVVREGDQQRQIATLKSGDCFGEIALLTDAPRTATVRCVTPVDLLVLPRAEFMSLAEGYRDFGRALRSQMTERAPRASHSQSVGGD